MTLHITPDLLQQQAAMLHPLAQAGMGGPMLTFLVDLNLEGLGLPRLSEEMRLYLGGPIVCHNDTHDLDEMHPVRTLKPWILTERLDIAFGASPYTVGPAEIVAVLFNQMLAQAPSHEGAEVWIWASCTALSRVTPHSRDAIYDLLRCDRDRLPGSGEYGNRTPHHLTDAQVLTEQPWCTVYRRIAMAIRAKVIEAARARRGDNHAAPSGDLFAGL